MDFVAEQPKHERHQEEHGEQNPPRRHPQPPGSARIGALLQVDAREPWHGRPQREAIQHMRSAGPAQLRRLLEAWCNRPVRLEAGRIAALGTVRELAPHGDGQDAACARRARRATWIKEAAPGKVNGAEEDSNWAD